MPLDHNLSAVRLPDGVTKNFMKEKVQLSRRLTERERALLFFVLDQADSWILTVRHIRDRMQWGEERWRTVRTGLTKKGILLQEKIRLACNSHVWRLNFDFVVVLDLCDELSTDPTKTRVSRARTRSTTMVVDHVTLGDGRGSRDPTYGGRLITSEEPKEPPQAAVVVPLSIQKMGLTDAQAARVCAAAGGAGQEQLDRLLLAWQAAAARPAGAGVGLAVFLARLASSGQLEIDSAPAGQPVAVEQAETAAQICDRIGAGHGGHLVSGPGVPGPLKAGPFGRLEAPTGGVLDASRAARVWLRVESGELDCRPSQPSQGQVSVKSQSSVDSVRDRS